MQQKQWDGNIQTGTNCEVHRVLGHILGLPCYEAHQIMYSYTSYHFSIKLINLQLISYQACEETSLELLLSCHFTFKNELGKRTPFK